MDFIHNKPKLLYFQYRYDERLAAFLLIHKREHVKCLSQFFDVTVISEDCDYQRICDKYQPDLTLVESGVPFASCRRPNVSNRRACPGIPKLGFLHADGFGEGRAGFLSDMDHWGIETLFAIATTAAEHTPEIADRLFVWPNFVDAEVYRDYGQWKSIPVLFTGNKNALYPWRQKLIRLVPKHYASLTSPHPGYSPARAAAPVTVGEPYARMLNASWFVPACGTVAKEIVRKHFEIPSCRACLITEQTPAIEAAGFADMENCVFADEHDILDKMAYLFRNPDVLNRIIDAGHDLVHSRHTLKHRDQIFQWYGLQKILKPNQQIIQSGPFALLSIADRSATQVIPYLVSNGLHLTLLRQADEKLWQKDYAGAENLYLKCANYYRYMPEPQLGMALCNLYKGNAKAALSWILKPVQFTLADYKAEDPDPVEWAYFVLSLLCLGKIREAIQRADDFAWLRHPELDRVRSVIAVISGERGSGPRGPDTPGYRPSIHRLPERTLNKWVQQVCLMLRSCGQRDLAETVATGLSAQSSDLAANSSVVPVQAERGSDKRDGTYRKNGVSRMFRRRELSSRLRQLLKRPVKGVLQRLEAKLGYFLPYRMSEARKDEFFYAIQDLAREEDVKTILVLGARLREGTTEALLAGAHENGNNPSVFCIGSKGRLPGRELRLANAGMLSWCDLSSYPAASLDRELQRAVDRIKKENQIGCFDVLLIDGSELRGQAASSHAVAGELNRARFVLLDDINAVHSRDNYGRLLSSPLHFLRDQNPDLRGGYAIFERDLPAADSAMTESSRARDSASGPDQGWRDMPHPELCESIPGCKAEAAEISERTGFD